jgi:hypothetical protein
VAFWDIDDTKDEEMTVDVDVDAGPTIAFHQGRPTTDEIFEEARKSMNLEKTESWCLGSFYPEQSLSDLRRSQVHQTCILAPRKETVTVMPV